MTVASVTLADVDRYDARMPQTLTGWRVFLGSPGGLEPERAAIQSALDRFNRERCLDEGACFVLRDWSDVPGGVTRPQEKINEEVRASDFVVILLHNRWGSPTGSDGGHSSGTAEEFDLTVEGLGDESSPIRDLLVLFKSVDPDRMADPGEQLKKVLAFKAALESSQEIYFTVFDDAEVLVRTIELKVREWLDEPETKVVRPVTVRSTSVDDVTPEVSSYALVDLLERAAALQAQGLQTQAESLYALAAADEDPRAMLEYARFMRRRGRFDRSIELNERVLRIPSLLMATDGASVLLRSDCLANLGIVRRKSGDLFGSVEALREAVETAKSIVPVATDVLVYSLDNLGHSYFKLGNVEGARASYEEAIGLRTVQGDALGAARSSLNLARLLRQDGDLDGALATAQAALAAADESEDDLLKANAAAAVGEYHFLIGNYDDARAFTAASLETNARLRNSDGESISTLQLGRIELATGDLPSAQEHADACYAINLRSGNVEGLVIAEHLGGQVALAKQEPDVAVRVLRSALSKAVELGSPSRESLVRSDLAIALAQTGIGGAEAAAEVDRALVLATRSGDAFAHTAAQKAAETVAGVV